jgi:CO/xanthine dehydrogenase Mo-binding subunit
MPSPSHIVPVMVGDPGLCKALGIKGLGEIWHRRRRGGIANAIYHAIGKRVSDLPIILDKLQR